MAARQEAFLAFSFLLHCGQSVSSYIGNGRRQREKRINLCRLEYSLKLMQTTKKGSAFVLESNRGNSVTCHMRLAIGAIHTTATTSE